MPHGIPHCPPYFHALHDGTSIHSSIAHMFPMRTSGSIYALCRRKRANSEGHSLLLGVSDERAPWIRQEIRSIAEVVPNPLIRMGSRVTSAALKTEGLTRLLYPYSDTWPFRGIIPCFPACAWPIHT